MSTPGYRRGSASALGALAGWRTPIKDITPADVIEPAVSLEKMRRRTPIGWLQSVCTGLGGAGLGALLQGGSGVGVYAALFGGFGIALGLQSAVHERNVSVANLCAEFLRFVDRWPPMGEHSHECNSDYVKAIVTTENPSLWTRASNKREAWRERRQAKK